MSNKSIVTMDDYISQLSQEMVKEIVRIVDQQAKELGETYADRLVLTFISGLIGQIVYGVLNSRPNKNISKEEMCSYTQQAFANVKKEMQNAVATGFQGAMSTFSGQPVEYYCQILPIPQPISKLSN